MSDTWLDLALARAECAVARLQAANADDRHSRHHRIMALYQLRHAAVNLRKALREMGELEHSNP